MLRHALTAGVNRIPALHATAHLRRYAATVLRPSVSLRAFRTSALGRSGAIVAMGDPTEKLNLSLDDIISRNSRRRSQVHTRSGDDGEMDTGPYTPVDPEDKAPRRVFVNNLSFDTQWQTLKDHFKQAGEVKYADVLREREYPHRSRGCGLVEFETEEEAQRAIAELDQTELDGRGIFVRADQGRKKPEGGASPREPREQRAPREERGRKRFRDDEGGDEGRRERQPRTTRNLDIAGRQIVLYGLPWRMQWQDLKDLGNDESGGVVRAEIVIDRQTGRSRGFGTLLFETEEDAQKAISVLNGLEFDGRYLTAKMDEYV